MLHFKAVLKEIMTLVANKHQEKINLSYYHRNDLLPAVPMDQVINNNTAFGIGWTYKRKLYQRGYSVGHNANAIAQQNRTLSIYVCNTFHFAYKCKFNIFTLVTIGKCNRNF